MLRVGVVALGVQDMRGAESFWTSALGYVARRDGFGGWETVLVPPDGVGTIVALQQSDTPAEGHPRVHLDLHVDTASEQADEVARLLQLGASRVEWDGYSGDDDFVVLADPDGNRFCVVDLSYRRAAGSES